MGCTGGVCSDGLSGTICFIGGRGAACCEVRPAARERNAASIEAITTGAIHPILFTISRPRKFESAALLRLNYAFLLTTSSMLVPKSLSMTVAAFRPGAPVTEPPGNVVAPVWYNPGIGMRCWAHPGIGRIGPVCDALCAPACALPCQKCGFT